MRVYLDSDDCLLGLDTSGEALHRRGYRLAASKAPLKETIAAGILFLSGWNRRMPLLDPFCGSGTIAVEAALWRWTGRRASAAPFRSRTCPSLSAAAAMLAAPERSLSGEIEGAKARVRRDAEFRIIGSDADPRALEAARANAARAGVAAGLDLRLGKVEDARPDYEVGSLICNPPYGERLGTVDEAEATYRVARLDGGAIFGLGHGLRDE